jgi:hypothetical protein
MRLGEFQRKSLDQVICFKQAGRIPHRNIMKSLRLMAKHVLPHSNPRGTVAIEDMAPAVAGSR